MWIVDNCSMQWYDIAVLVVFVKSPSILRFMSTLLPVPGLIKLDSNPHGSSNEKKMVSKSRKLTLKRRSFWVWNYEFQLYSQTFFAGNFDIEREDFWILPHLCMLQLFNIVPNSKNFLWRVTTISYVKANRFIHGERAKAPLQQLMTTRMEHGRCIHRNVRGSHPEGYHSAVNVSIGECLSPSCVFKLLLLLYSDTRPFFSSTSISTQGFQRQYEGASYQFWKKDTGSMLRRKRSFSKGNGSQTQDP